MNRNDLNLENLTHSPRSLLVCHGKSCRKLGAAKVWAAFQAHSIESVKITASSCLGQCGNGVMVLVLPEEIWYSRIQPHEVATIIEHHLNRGIPVRSMLYQKFHPSS